MRLLLPLVGLSVVLSTPAAAETLEQEFLSALPGGVAGWTLQEKGKGTAPQPFAYGYWKRGKDEHMFVLIAHPDLDKAAAQKLAASVRPQGWKPKISGNRVLRTRPSDRQIRMVFDWQGADPKVGTSLLQAAKWGELDKVAALPKVEVKKKTWVLLAPPKTPAEAVKMLIATFPKSAGRWKLAKAGAHVYGSSLAAMGYFHGPDKERLLVMLAVGVPRAQLNTAGVIFADRFDLYENGPRTFSYGSRVYSFRRRSGRVRYYFEVMRAPRNAEDEVLKKLDRRRIDAVLKADWNQATTYPAVASPKTPVDGVRMLIGALPKQVADWTLKYTASDVSDGAVDVVGIYAGAGSELAIVGFGTGSRKRHKRFVRTKVVASGLLKGRGGSGGSVTSDWRRLDRKGALLQSLNWIGVEESKAEAVLTRLNLTLLDAVQRAAWNTYGK